MKWLIYQFCMCLYKYLIKNNIYILDGKGLNENNKLKTKNKMYLKFK